MANFCALCTHFSIFFLSKFFLLVFAPPPHQYRCWHCRWDQNNVLSCASVPCIYCNLNIILFEKQQWAKISLYRVVCLDKAAPQGKCTMEETLQSVTWTNQKDSPDFPKICMGQPKLKIPLKHSICTYCFGRCHCFENRCHKHISPM